MDDAWREAFGAWSPAASAARAKLEERAAALASGVEALPSGLRSGEVDVVCRGCGFLILHFLGAHQVLSRTKGLALRRYAGASSSGQAPVQILLDGEAAAVESYLTYGELQDRFRPWLGIAGSVWRCDRHWREYLSDLVDRHAARLASLDGRMHVSVSCFVRLGSWPKNFLISEFGSPEEAKQTLYATGTALTRCQGHWATDGGVTNACPIFKDGVRPNVVVNPTNAGLPLSQAARYTFEDAVAAIELGQDDMAAFLKGLAPQAGVGGPVYATDGGGS